MGASSWRQTWDDARARAPRHRPFVTAAFALSADGFLTEERGRPTAISCAESLRVTHALRGAHDAILIGRGTQRSDDPRLTTRFEGGRTGLRVLLDGELQLSPAARLVTSEERPLLVFASSRAPHARELALRGRHVEVERVPHGVHGLSLPAVLGSLARRGVESLMVEGGAAVLESFFRAGLVDFVCLTTAPRCIAAPRALPCGPVTREALASWRPAAAFRAGDDHVTAGALPRSAVEAVG